VKPLDWWERVVPLVVLAIIGLAALAGILLAAYAMARDGSGT
jgi:hypothetical protein